MNIHVWVPDYAVAVGGIQTVSRSVVRGLRDLFPDARITVFAKNDTSYPDTSGARIDGFKAFGWWPHRLRTVAFAGSLFHCAIREGPALIYMTHANFAPVAAHLRRWIRATIIAQGNGVEVWKIRNRGLVKALRKIGKLVAISDVTRKRMALELAIDPLTISILAPTFDSEKFVPNQKPQFLLKRHGLRLNQPVIFTITRLAAGEKYKGYDQMIRALPEVRKRFPDVRYVLGGRGSDRPRIEALIREFDVAENVSLTGYIPDHEMCSYYNLCDVFAMPSKGEGFGIVFLEAASCGKPVIAGNKDASVEAVLNGRLGILVNPDDPAEIASAVIQILSQRQSSDSPWQPTVLRRDAINAFGYDRFVEQLGKIVSEVKS